MKSMLRNVRDKEVEYQALLFWCPGCAEAGGSGAHLLPVNTDKKTPSWNFDGNTEKPTLNPSILSGKGTDKICHSFLRAGVFEYLSDSTHSMAGKHIELPDLPDWLVDENTN